MSQIMLPSADKYDANGWTKQPGGATTNLYQAVNDGSDSTYMQTGFFNSGGNNTNRQITKLAAPGGTPSPGTVTIHARKGNWTGSEINEGNGKTELRQGVVDNTDLGTLIAKLLNGDDGTSSNSPVTGPTDFSYTLSGPEAASITDYTDLYLVEYDTTLSWQGQIFEYSLEVPDSSVTGSGSATLEAPGSVGVGSVFWKYTGILVLPRPFGTGSIVIPPPSEVGQVAVGTVNGQRVVGIVLKLDADGLGNPLVLYGINPASTGQQIRWAAEGIMSDAEEA